jgi:glycosyltransferase involved in cell wall biosynthesis
LDAKISLHIVGDGPFKEELSHLAAKLGVSGRISWFKNLSRTELLKEYSEADIFVLLSQHEAYGITVAEALSAQTPCILANSSALSEWIDNKNCFGIDYPIQTSRLASLVQEVVSRRTPVERMGFLTWKDVVSKTTSVYEELLPS